MSMVIYVGLDVHLNSIAAVWGRAKARMFIHNIPMTAQPRSTSMAGLRDEGAVMR